MMPMLEWLENTWISTTLRDSPNVFLYPTILAFHTIGLAFVVGLSSAVSLRILGVARAVPLAPMKRFFPLMWFGFWLNAASGVLLLLIEPTKFLAMADFYYKLLAIAVALVCMRWLQTRVFREPATLRAEALPAGPKLVATALLVAWVGAITGGRLTAYDDPHTQWVTALATLVVSIVLLLAGYVVVQLWHWAKSLVPHTTVDLPESGHAPSR
jgi:hypothetical protein